MKLKNLKEKNINGFEFLKMLINKGFIYVKDAQKVYIND